MCVQIVLCCNLLLQVSSIKPLVVYEIKTQIYTKPALSDILECFLQAYYTIKSYDVSPVDFCLTDFQVWHYFNIKQGHGDALLEIVNYRKFFQENAAPSEKETIQHINFVLGICTESEVVEE